MQGTETQDEVLPATVEEVAEWMASASPAAVEAQASWWMRQQTALTAEVCAIDEREEAELALIRSHYATQRTPRADRIAALERCVLAIAERLTFAKGKKSVALTWGTIGRRTKPEAVEVADEALALAFAKTLAGGVKVTEKPVLAVVKPAVLARLADGGEEVEGFTIVPEHDLPYLKLTSREDA